MSQTPSVQRFLTNIDVVHAVFGQLDLSPRSITSGFDSLELHLGHETVVIRRTLVNAALTCRAFSEPASKTLWTCLHVGLLPLLKIFSCLTRKEIDSDPLYFGLARKEIFYALDGEIFAAEWQQFDRLASRVRYLDFQHAALEPSVMDTLVRRYQTKGAALLPNLHILCWAESLGHAPVLQLLRALCATPSLSLVSISPCTKYGYSVHVAQDLAAIADTRPDLAHFSSNGYMYLQLNSPLFSLRSLKSLKVGQVDDASFHQIGTFPYLTDLSTTLSDVRDAESPPGSEGAFLALRRLTTSGAPATLVWMVAQISSSDLTSLSVQSQAKYIADILPPLETLFALPTVQVLQQLHLSINFDVEAFSDGSGERMEVAFADLAHSILTLPHLEDVRLHVKLRTLSLSDADILLIKFAWPRLRRLSLSSDASEPVQHIWQPSGVTILRPSLLALVDLALARPQLETLDVEVASVTEDDLVQLETIATGAPGLEHPRTLTWLTLARDEYRGRITLPTDIPRLARALHRLFPLVGGLGRPIEEAEEGFTRYYLWSGLDMRHDVFQVLYHLEKLKSQRACILFQF
ncbi:hypothetical protein C8Q74DRAFT_191682 [Fomes fomentarius]|nr:hypothetical protein C8Q74DRAFT_191682 [Fomes fomentarius]